MIETTLFKPVLFAVELSHHYVGIQQYMAWRGPQSLYVNVVHELADVVEFEPPVATNAGSTHVHHWFRKLAAANLIFNFHFIPCNF